MHRLSRFVRGFGRFWYDFVVGDDPKIAVAVVVVLSFGAVVVAAGVTGPAFVASTGLLLLAAFTVAMTVDVRRSRRS